MKKEKSELIYVQLNKPEDVKKELLGTLKDIVQNLKRFEKFKEIKKEKHLKLTKLHNTVKELHKLFHSFRNDLPEANLKSFMEDSETPDIDESKRKTQKRKSDDIDNANTSQLEKLETELNDIEEKLRALK